jgi:hypothetical protein
MYHTTLDTRKPELRARLLQAINEDCVKAKDVLNVPIDLIGYTLSPAGRMVEGELQEWVRCVLHLADGRNVAAGSMGLVRSLMLIEQLDRPAPWEPPMTVVLKARDLGNSKQWYSLALPPTPREEATATTKAARKERYG